jgi:hypothetical protein
MKLRTAALVAFIATVISLPFPLWNLIHSIFGLISANRITKWSLLEIPIILAITLINPVFCFALYQNTETLNFSGRSRTLALAGAFAFGGYFSTTVPAWRSHDPATMNVIARLLGEASNFAYVALLIVIFRQAQDEAASVIPVWHPLKMIAKWATVIGGVWAAFNVVRVIAAPYFYMQYRALILLNGHAHPIWEVMRESVQALLSSTALFIAAYVVHKAIKSPATYFPSTENASSTLPDIPPAVG